MTETFPAVLARLYGERYTGPIIIQFGEGVPSVIEIPQPAIAIRLDKPPKRRHDVTHALDARL